MLLDLSEIVIRDEMRADVAIDQPSVEDPDLLFAEPIRGRLIFQNGGGLINIRGKVATALLAPCSRCLQEVRFPVRLDVEEHFPIEEVLHPDRKPRPDEEFDSTISSVVYIHQGRPMMDLDELLRQLIVAEVPIRILCNDSCAGICPTCGANRNYASCACTGEPASTPLAGLGALLGSEPM